MELLDIKRELSGNSYPGRGIIIGRSADGKKAVCAYFIMGRSENSRNRVFVADGDGIRTKAFDESKLSDPSLIIYAPVRVYEGRIIVTNGDQTDTVYEGLSSGKSFSESLAKRQFEPDAPHFTPRISGIMDLRNGKFSYELSILKSDSGRDAQCLRYTFSYPDPVAGEGRFIHTYAGDANPLPSFYGEPKRFFVGDDIDVFSTQLWNSLNEENKVSLFVRTIDIATGKFSDRIINKNENGKTNI